MENYKKFKKSYINKRRSVFIVWLLFIPFGVLISQFFYRPFSLLFDFVYLMTFVYSVFSVINMKCPKCNKRFSLAYGSRCSSCGLTLREIN